MSIITNVSGDIQKVGSFEYASRKLDPEEVKKGLATISDYQPIDSAKEVRAMVVNHFTLGYNTMYKPRLEFNDLSVIGRDQVDQASYNTYQPANGQPSDYDDTNSWRSNAISPVVRNKIVSIAAHATQHDLFPTVFAYDQDSNAQNEAGQVMRDLMEWSCDQSGYSQATLYAVIGALFSPCSYVFSECSEVYRNYKTTDKGDDGKWKVERRLDENFSGFKDTVVPCTEIFIENIYEHDIQKQAWLIWRRVISYDNAKTKYQKYGNFKYVKPGVQVIFNDANQFFYEVYDSNMRQDMVEEVVYWNKGLDVKLILVNGILLSEPDAPNPRQDKQYPFVKFGYQLIDQGRFFYYKSMAFALQPQANTVNELLPMVVDGAYLSIIPPVAVSGAEKVGWDVIVPGLTTNFTDPNTKVTPILGNGIAFQVGLDTLNKIESGLSETSQDPISILPAMGGKNPTDDQMQQAQQSVQVLLGLFVKMILQYVKDYGNLRVSDITQYLTMPKVEMIEDQPQLVYKAFIMPQKKGKNQSKKIEFTTSIPHKKKSKLEVSHDLMKKEKETGQTIIQVNPIMFRDFKYRNQVSAEIIQPRNDDTEKAMKLELYDRAIQRNQDDPDYQNKIAEDFLFGAYKDIRDPSEYISKQKPQPQENEVQQPQGSPLNALANTKGIKTPQATVAGGIGK